MTLRELLEKRSKLVVEMRSLTNSPAGDGGDLSTEQTAKFDQFKTELESLEKQIERQKLVDDAERRMSGEKLTGNGDGGFNDLCRDFSLQRAIASQIDPRSVDAGREIEISKELSRRSGRAAQGIRVPLDAFVERRVQTVAADAQYITATNVLADMFIDALRPATVLGALGARFLTGLRDSISIPKMDAATPAAAWLETEGTSGLTSADHSFTAVTGSPHICGLLTTWSRKTLLQSNPSIEQLVRADFTAKLAAAVDLAGLAGTGATGQPEGILVNSSVSEEALAGGAVTWADVLNMIAAVLGADVRGGKFGWTFNAFVQAYLRKTVKESGGEFYIMEDPNSLAGYPVQITSQMDGANISPAVSGKMLFGDFSQVILAFWGDGGADILINPYESTAYAAGNVLMRAFIDADVLIRHPEGFCKAEGITLS
jgi:HK97 family phage major capsid protein